MIQLERVTKRFGQFTAVDQVSLTVAPGQIYGLLGANGAGKTTLIRMMCGLITPTSGGGKVAGYDMVSERAKIKEKIGYMSQKFSLYPDLTVEENLLFYMQLYRVTEEGARMEALLDHFDLAEVRKKRVEQLASGVRQRVAFAAAIVHDPPLLFLDEPTSGVDPLYRRHFWEGLYRLAEEGTTILITTHYMDEAERCERLALMNRGRIVAEGRLTDLKKEYSSVTDHSPPTLEAIFHRITAEEGTDDGEEGVEHNGLG